MNQPLSASSSLKRASYQLFSPHARRSPTAEEDTSKALDNGIYEASISHSSPPLHGKLWQTGYLRNTPWGGIGSLLLVLSSTIASAIVLAVSNGDAVSNWRVAPSVVLAILSAVSIACLRFSLGSGLNVSWWRNLVEGAPLNETHRYWDHGTNIWAAMTAGRRFSFLSIAKLLVVVAAIAEGPFIQQASKISNREVSEPLSLRAALAVNLPPGYTADITGEYQVPTTPSSPFSGAFNNYTNRVSITNGFDGCPGVCKASVPGVGFKVSCAPDVNTTWTMKDYTGGDVTKPQFTTNTTWLSQALDSSDSIAYDGSYEYLTLSAGWAINTGTPLLFVNRVCNLSLAVVSYPLQIVNNTVSLILPLGTNPEVLYDLPTASTPRGEESIGSTTLGGFSLIGNVNNFGKSSTEGPFYANVSMTANGARAIYSLIGLNSYTWSHSLNSDTHWNFNSYQGYAWRDPVPDTLGAYHEIMFRLGLSAATNETLVNPIVLGGKPYTSVRNISATYVFTEPYYVSNYRYLAGVVAVILLAVISVMSTLRGWWKIGRPTTLSPLETANAFGAPLLAECNSNDIVKNLVHNTKGRLVKYGATKGDEVGVRGRRLRIEDHEEVDTPRPGTTFQQ